MDRFQYFQEKIRGLKEDQFEAVALELFRYQATENPVYRTYLHYLEKDPAKVRSLEDIPFLPIAFFKTQQVRTGTWTPQVVFESSGTTSDNTSKHAIRDMAFYHEIAARHFEKIFGPLDDCLTLALLPSYLERNYSSLVSMVHHFIERSQPGSGFYLHNTSDLLQTIERNKGRKIILWGVTFALLELAQTKPDLSEVIIIETGGMKGRGPELTREALYEVLRASFGVSDVYSEYGMTELLSQSYAVNGQFKNSTTMRGMIRQTNDPFRYVDQRKTGGVNVIDLANIHSCAFIETQDLGRYTSENSFEILGRFDNSDLRGCNLLINV